MRRLPRSLFLAALVVTPAAFRLVADAVGPVATRGARVSFSETDFDFGRAAHGQTVEHRYRFRNTGDQRLEVTRVQSSCGCTASRPSSRSLAPGEAADLVVRFDTRSKPASRPEHTYVHHILVSTNATETPDVRLVLHGVVVSRFSFVPQGGLIFSKRHVLGHEEENRASVEIYPRTAGALDRAEVVSKPPGLRVQPFEPCTRKGRAGLRLTVGLSDELEPGPVRGSLTVQTTDPEQPQLEVPIYATVLAPFRASPPSVYLTTDGGPRLLRIVPSRRDLPPLEVFGFEVLGFEVQEEGGASPSIRATRAPARTGRALLALSLQPKEPTRAGSGRVVVRLASARTPVVVVPYRVFDRAGRKARVAEARAAHVIVSPPDLELRRYAVGASQEAHVTLTTLGGPLRVTDLGLRGSDQLEVRQEPLPGNRAVRLFISIRADRPGPIRATLFFRPRPGAPQLEVPIQGQILPALKAVPEGACLIAGHPTATVWVRRRDGRPLSSKMKATLHVTPSALRATLRRERDALAIDLDGAGLPKGPVDATLWVESDLPGEPPLRVPVFGTR